MEPVPDPRGSSRLARRVLAAAVAVQALFFVIEARRAVRAAVTEPTRAHTGGAAVAGMDPHGYYAWLRSPLIDGDFDFGNEFAYCNENWNRPMGRWYEGRTPTGLHVNHWSVGPALAWAVAVVPVHVGLGAFGLWGEGIEAGYTPPYQLAVAGATFALAVATLLLTYATARRFAPPVPSAAAATGVALGTPLLAYGTIVPAMAHGPAAAAVALFVYTWVRTLGSRRAGRWFGLGVLLGVVCLMRWQLATFGVLPGLEAVWLGWGSAAGLARAAGRLVLVAAGAAVGFLPQMLAWQAVYGSPLVSPLPVSFERVFSPALWQVLGSTDRGLFYWTPVALVAAAGCAFAVFRAERRSAVPLVALLLAAAVQVYAVAVLLGGNIFLGSSFGFRFLTETCVVLVPGLAVALDRFRPAVARAIVAAVAVLVAWNMLLVCGFWTARVPEGPATPGELFRAVAATFARRPVEGVATAGAAAWFAAWFVLRVVPALRAATVAKPVAVAEAVSVQPIEVRRAA